MRLFFSSWFLRFLPFMLVAFALTPAPVEAQLMPVKVTWNQKRNTVDVDAYRAPALRLIETLFANATGGGVSFDVRTNVTGNVTIHLKDYVFDDALRLALKQVGAGFRVERGVYRIMTLAELNAPPASPPRPAERCTRCRYELQRDWHFCPNCGRRLD